MKSIRERSRAIIDKYREKFAGKFGEFISRCKNSSSLKRSGMIIQSASKTNLSWNEQMNTTINAYVKKRVHQKRREFEKTYKRPNRRAGFVEDGDIIVKGKRIKDNKLMVNVAFYIDRSGSMSGNIDKVFDAAYILCESIKKHFKREKVVEDTVFKMHAFDTDMQEVKYGNRSSAGGGTMPFHSILSYMKDNTKDYLINVIITDAEFDINESEVAKFINDIDGMILFITNTPNETMKSLAKTYKTKLFYVESSHDFS